MDNCNHKYEWAKYLQEAMVCVHCNRIMRPEDILKIVEAAQQSAQADKLATLRAQLAEAREALEPFAKYGSKCTEYEESTWEFRIKGRHFAKALKVHNKLVITA